MQKLVFTQDLPLTIEECWQFFSRPKNLSVITPSYIGFSMEYDEQEMYAGQIITHTIRPFLGVPIKWVTEITHVLKYSYFIDEQRLGPYKFWHHEHRFLAIKDGVKMIDIVCYKLPFGFLGDLVNVIKVRRDVEFIFHYRQQKLKELFKSSY